MEFIQITAKHILIFAEIQERENDMRYLITKSFSEVEKLRRSLKDEDNGKCSD